MWLLTSEGFFSIVQKPDDMARGTLTIRARVKADLQALRIPGMTEIEEDAGTDYRYRAIAPRDEVAAAVSAMVQKIDYSNFKDEIARKQGKQRAAIYGELWEVLYRLQTAMGR